MKTIPLTQGKFAIVDDEDFEYVSQFKWCALKKGNGWFYAVRHHGKRPNRILLRMQNLIMNPPDGMLVDHINSDRLDNRRQNLRLATETENLRNRSLSKNNSTGFKGVSIWKKRGIELITANLGSGSGRVYLGVFQTLEKAAKAYDDAALLHFGEFAKTNKMMGLLT